MSTTEIDEITVFLIGENRNVNKVTLPIQENKLIVNDNYNPFFDPECVFSVKDISTVPLLGKFINRHRARYPALFQRIGKLKAEKLLAPKKSDIFEPLTNEERKEIVKRQVAETLSEGKQFENWQFLILMFLNIFVLILGILAASGVRIG